MPSRSHSVRHSLCFVALAAALLCSAAAFAQQPAPSSNPLIDVLVKKGILTSDDVRQINLAATPAEANERIARLLLAKGILTPDEFAQAVGKAPASAPVVATAPAPAAIAPAKPALVAAEKSPAIIAAVTPIRFLPVGGVPRDSLKPALTIDGAGFTPYAILKTTVIEDSSSPNGDDFPLPGFINDTGPDGSPEFHVKARSSRLGFKFAWFDPSPRLSITGKLEFDFEGNFNRSDNRNITSIRSSNPSLRVAWARTDFTIDAHNTISALFGQDWTPFASSTIPTMLETTGNGIAFGALYERLPQMRVGFTHKFTAFQLMPEFAVVLPAEGLVPSASNVSAQLGYGERQGADSNQPNLEGRVVAQWQLDHAPGVAPAQLILSAEHGSRTAIVTAASVPTAYKATFPTGATGSSSSAAWTVEAQLPSRFATLTGKLYSGSDLRHFLGGQLYSYFCDTAGLTNTATVASVDGSSSIVFGTTASGTQIIAPERPIRSIGGFAQLGLPLSHIFAASPTGRNAGWTLQLLYGIDQAKTRDLNRLGATGVRRYSTMAVGTLSYSLNKWTTFSFEQSLYTTHANPEQPLPLFRGVASREWNDIRSEFGPTFTF
jgi:hypothetical protein